MLVDFAIQREREGGLPHEAIREACLLRFRPILMTTMAAMLGGVPLMLGHGAGSELRQPLGYAMVGRLGAVAGADALHDADRLSLSRAAPEQAHRPEARKPKKARALAPAE